MTYNLGPSVEAGCSDLEIPQTDMSVTFCTSVGDGISYQVCSDKNVTLNA